MRTVLELFLTYGNVGILFLVCIQMIMVIAAIHMIRRLKKHIEMIQKKVSDYLSVVMEEDAEMEETSEHVVSMQERQLMESLARKQKNQQEEIFNAVLQEIFP